MRFNFFYIIRLMHGNMITFFIINSSHIQFTLPWRKWSFLVLVPFIPCGAYSMPMPGVCLSVYPSLTARYYVETAEPIELIFGRDATQSYLQK